MKVTPSPLVGTMRGRTGGLVAALWKGRQYVRRHVIPHNPNTDPQKAVRLSLTHCVELWRSLNLPLKAYLDVYGTGYAMSGANIFMGKNRALEQLASLLVPIPANPNVDAPPAFAYDSEPTATSLKVIWTASGKTGYTLMWLALRETTSNRFSAIIETTLDTAASYTFPTVVAGKTYQIYAALLSTDGLTYGTVAAVEHAQTP